MLNLMLIIDTVSKGFSDHILQIISLFSFIFGILVINSKNPIVSVFFLIGLFISVSLNLIFMGFNFIGLSYLLVYVGAVSILFLFILMLINIRISELLNDTNNGIPIAIFTVLVFGFPIHEIIVHLHSIKDKFKNLDITYLLKSELDSEDLAMQSQHNNIKKNLFEINILPHAELSKQNTNNDVLSYQNNFILSENFSNNCEEELNYNFNHQNYNNDIYYALSKTWDKNLIENNDITSIGNVLYTTYGIWLIICSIILLLAMIGAISITKKEKN